MINSLFLQFRADGFHVGQNLFPLKFFQLGFGELCRVIQGFFNFLMESRSSFNGRWVLDAIVSCLDLDQLLQLQIGTGFFWDEPECVGKGADGIDVDSEGAVVDGLDGVPESGLLAEVEILFAQIPGVSDNFPENGPEGKQLLGMELGGFEPVGVSALLNELIGISCHSVGTSRLKCNNDPTNICVMDLNILSSEEQQPLRLNLCKVGRVI